MTLKYDEVPIHSYILCVRMVTFGIGVGRWMEMIEISIVS